VKNYALRLSLCTLLIAAAIMLACGTSLPRITESVTVSPPTADAINFPNGQVQFTATAAYSRPPSPVQNVQAAWGVCFQGTFTSDVTVSATGTAQCAAGASGTYVVWANVPTGMPHQVCTAVFDPCGGNACQVVGVAQLTCP